LKEAIFLKSEKAIRLSLNFSIESDEKTNKNFFVLSKVRRGLCGMARRQKAQSPGELGIIALKTKIFLLS
jgi:hypothetical protein